LPEDKHSNNRGSALDYAADIVCVFVEIRDLPIPPLQGVVYTVFRCNHGDHGTVLNAIAACELIGYLVTPNHS
jgi:hypothetical protein